MEETDQQVERVVRGGATMFPRESPRPKPLEWAPLLQNFVVETIRGPAIAAVFTQLTYPKFAEFVRGRYGGDEQKIFVATMTASHVAIYSAMFAFFEGLAHTEWLHQYQLPRTPAQEPTWKMKLKVLQEFAVGQVLNYLVVLPWAHGFFTNYGGKFPSVFSPLPSLGKMMLQFALCLHFNQFLFAAAHRLFHHGPLYRRFHKKHHEFVGTVSIAAENAHPVEQLLANVIPTVGGAFFLGTHPYVFFVWIAWRLQQTLEAHSGYCFYGSWLQQIGLTNSESAAFHDFHHTANKGAFGSELSDHMFGTLDAWIAVGRTKGYLEKARLQHEQEKKKLA